MRTDLRAGAQNYAPEAKADADKGRGDEQAPVDVKVIDDQPKQESPKKQRRVTGADGKSYPAPARDAPPPAPRNRGGRRRHQQVLEAMTTRLSAFAAMADEIIELDGSMTRDEAAKFARDLDQQIPALDRMKNLLKKYAVAADRADAAERGDVG